MAVLDEFAYDGRADRPCATQYENSHNDSIAVAAAATPSVSRSASRTERGGPPESGPSQSTGKGHFLPAKLLATAQTSRPLVQRIHSLNACILERKMPMYRLNPLRKGRSGTSSSSISSPGTSA